MSRFALLDLHTGRGMIDGRLVSRAELCFAYKVGLDFGRYHFF